VVLDLKFANETATNYHANFKSTTLAGCGPPCRGRQQEDGAQGHPDRCRHRRLTEFGRLVGVGRQRGLTGRVLPWPATQRRGSAPAPRMRTPSAPQASATLTKSLCAPRQEPCRFGDQAEGSTDALVQITGSELHTYDGCTSVEPAWTRVVLQPAA
jgi:hypothetical protein